MNKIIVTAICALPLAMGALAAGQSEIEKFDPAMACDHTVVSNGVKWIDGRLLPIEGRAFDDVEHYYDRLPANVTTNVNRGVRSMKHHTAGMQFRFSTDSKTLHFRWVPYKAELAMDHMPARTLCPNDDRTLSFKTFEGTRLVSLCNGDASSRENFKGSSMRTFHGLLVAAVEGAPEGLKFSIDDN